MSWLFSRALVEAFSAGISLDGDASAPLNVMPTARQFWHRDKMMDVCQRSPFGLTWRALTDDHGAALLTSYLAGFPVRTSAPVAKARASQESAADCGESLRGSLAKWDRATYSWRTHQRSLDGEWELFSETWPRWGMMRDGACWERRTPSGVLEIRARIMSAIESGFLRLPTPRVADGTRYGTAPKDTWKMGMTANLLRDYVQRFPTPLKQDAKHHPKNWEARMNSNQFVLPDVVGMLEASGAQRFPTPMSRDWKSAGVSVGGQQRRTSPNLETIVMKLEPQRYATPASSDGTRGGKMITEGMSGQSLCQQIGGPLNPEFHEWLMGWPIGWTELATPATDRFQRWCALHGKSSPKEKIE